MEYESRLSWNWSSPQPIIFGFGEEALSDTGNMRSQHDGAGWKDSRWEWSHENVPVGL